MTSCAEVYGEDGVLVNRVTGQIPVLARHRDTVYAFPSSYKVPEYGKTYRVKVFVSASDGDKDLSDDTLETSCECRTEVVDVCVDSIFQPAHVPHASGSFQRIGVCVGNLGDKNLKNLTVMAETLDSNFAVIRKMLLYVDTLSAKSHREVLSPASYQVPAYKGIYFIQAYVSRVSGDANVSNDTIRDVFEIMLDDAVEAHGQSGWSLGQNIPNPAADRTLVPVSLPEAGAVRLQVFAADGRLLYRGELELPFGKSLLPLETGGYAAGVYFYSVEYRGERKVRKMQVLQ